MATTDQLRKAERGPQNPSGLTLNAYPRDRYISELEARGWTGIRGWSKLKLFATICKLGIKIIPDWHGKP
jgi:hypothetical protein